MAESLRSRGWRLYDEVVASAPLRETNPWTRAGDGTVFEPDFDTLSKLLGVPVLLEANSQSGVPAIALDVWVSYELRRAGFDADRVWPRASEPRVLPQEIVSLVDSLPKSLRAAVSQRIASNKADGVAKSANLLGKNYVKQVDVVMSSWATGPELMVSTKRMDSSFGKNAANRVEESYGDAKNLRLRYPQAALGFVYALSAASLDRERDTAMWLIDLLQKLGREDDAYDAVALVMPDLSGFAADGNGDEADPAGPLPAGGVVQEHSDEGSDSLTEAATVAADLERLRPVPLSTVEIPFALSPGRFFETMCNRVLDNSPINFHVEARRRRAVASNMPAPMAYVSVDNTEPGS